MMRSSPSLSSTYKQSLPSPSPSPFSLKPKIPKQPQQQNFNSDHQNNHNPYQHHNHSHHQQHLTRTAADHSHNNHYHVKDLKQQKLFQQQQQSAQNISFASASQSSPYKKKSVFGSPLKLYQNQLHGQSSPLPVIDQVTVDNITSVSKGFNNSVGHGANYQQREHREQREQRQQRQQRQQQRQRSSRSPSLGRNTHYSQSYPSQPLPCHKCHILQLKISQLTSTYQQLLLCKADQISQYRQIIFKLQEKLEYYTEKVYHQSKKNLKFKQEIQRQLSISKSSSAVAFQLTEPVIEYLKNRQLLLLDQLKNVENQMFVKESAFAVRAVNGQQSWQEQSSQQLNSSSIQTTAKGKQNINNKNYRNKRNNNHQIKPLQEIDQNVRCIKCMKSSAVTVASKEDLVKTTNENHYLKDALQIEQIKGKIIRLENMNR